jgi:ketosteroid isomerase-like protein
MTQQLYEDTAQSIEHLAHEWVSAERRGDVVALAGLLTDDFVGVRPRGFLLTKEQWLQRHQSHALHYTSLALEDRQTRMYGEVAILIGRQRQPATYQGQDMPGEFRATLIWVRPQARWRLAGLQLSPLASQP